MGFFVFVFMWQTLSQSIIYPPNLITHRVELHVKDGRAAENYEGVKKIVSWNSHTHLWNFKFWVTEKLFKSVQIDLHMYTDICKLVIQILLIFIYLLRTTSGLWLQPLISQTHNDTNLRNRTFVSFDAGWMDEKHENNFKHLVSNMTVMQGLVSLVLPTNLSILF